MSGMQSIDHARNAWSASLTALASCQYCACKQGISTHLWSPLCTPCIQVSTDYVCTTACRGPLTNPACRRSNGHPFTRTTAVPAAMYVQPVGDANWAAAHRECGHAAPTTSRRMRSSACGSGLRAAPVAQQGTPGTHDGCCRPGAQDVWHERPGIVVGPAYKTGVAGFAQGYCIYCAISISTAVKSGIMACLLAQWLSSRRVQCAHANTRAGADSLGRASEKQGSQ